MRERPSAEVNSVMMRPQPDCWLVVAVSMTSVREADSSPSTSLRVRNDKSFVAAEKRLAFLMKRRKTVSVTPAMGASTVAGAMRTLPRGETGGERGGPGQG